MVMNGQRHLPGSEGAARRPKEGFLEKGERHLRFGGREVEEEKEDARRGGLRSYAQLARTAHRRCAHFPTQMRRFPVAETRPGGQQSSIPIPVEP